MNLPKWMYVADVARVTRYMVARNNLHASDVVGIQEFLLSARIDELERWEKETLARLDTMEKEEMGFLVENLYAGWVRAKVMEVYGKRFGFP